MLELTTKWMTNTLAKKSILNNDYIQCNNNQRLYVISYGNITSSGKNTYNVVLKDSEDKVLEEYSNLYLDAITKLILGTSPKSKSSKEAKESEVNKPKKNTKEANGCLLLTFDNAYKKACKMMESYKEVASILGKYDAKDAITLTLHLIKEANKSEVIRLKEAKKSEEIKVLQSTLAIAIEQGNTMLVDAIKEMIANKERE